MNHTILRRWPMVAELSEQVAICLSQHFPGDVASRVFFDNLLAAGNSRLRSYASAIATGLAGRKSQEHRLKAQVWLPLETPCLHFRSRSVIHP